MESLRQEFLIYSGLSLNYGFAHTADLQSAADSVQRLCQWNQPKGQYRGSFRY